MRVDDRPISEPAAEVKARRVGRADLDPRDQPPVISRTTTAG